MCKGAAIIGCSTLVFGCLPPKSDPVDTGAGVGALDSAGTETGSGTDTGTDAETGTGSDSGTGRDTGSSDTGSSDTDSSDTAEGGDSGGGSGSDTGSDTDSVSAGSYAGTFEMVMADAEGWFDQLCSGEVLLTYDPDVAPEVDGTASCTFEGGWSEETLDLEIFGELGTAPAAEGTVEFEFSTGWSDAAVALEWEGLLTQSGLLATFEGAETVDYSGYDLDMEFEGSFTATRE